MIAPSVWQFRPRAGVSRRSVRILEHDLLVFRRGWYSYVLSGLAQPFLYLVAMGIGLGLYVNRNGGLPGGVPYLNYIAPALLVTQAMMAAAFESAWPIMAKIMWDKTYLAALNTPVGAMDLLVGDLMWIAFRGTLLAALFLAVIVALGAASSPMVALAIPVAVLTAIAFAAPIMAFTATQQGDGGFNALFRFGITPLFLFSGTFFPIEKLPLFLQPLAWLTPLYHGVAVARSLSLGQIEPVAWLVHIGALVAFAVAGVVAGRITFRRRLEV
ncbi:MAG TPA: ABC transporter permease [Candidatus Limnocylindrales bacterium]|jgi:ABC-type multidrug transport system, permease component|nr:ABC transporter permease [Candidatus Limnocylindrales bacterium]